MTYIMVFYCWGLIKELIFGGGVPKDLNWVRVLCKQPFARVRRRIVAKGGRVQVSWGPESKMQG